MSGRLQNYRVVITGAGRDFGRALGICFARLGAEVFLSSRNVSDVEQIRSELVQEGLDNIHVFPCDLSNPASIVQFASTVANITSGIDILINNGAGWLEGEDIEAASDEEIINTITSGSAGLVLMVKHFLPLLRNSSKPDIVNMVSSAAFANDYHCRGHAAFYASKGGQGRAAQILSHRLRPLGIRVISLYPPDFENNDPRDVRWAEHRRSSQDRLTAQSLIECVVFAVSQPRDCFIKAFEFETI